MDTQLTLKDLYSFHGFRALTKLEPHPEDSGARVVTLRRRQKKVPALAAAGANRVIMTESFIAFGTWPAAAQECILNSNTAGSTAATVMP